MAKPANQWSNDGDYRTTDHVMRMLNVVNVVAERYSKLLQDFSGKITKGTQSAKISKNQNSY